MSLELHVTHSLDARAEELLLACVGRIERAIRNLQRNESIMNIKLQGVVTGLGPRLQNIDTVLASVQTFMSTGVSQIVAASVAKALADNDVEEGAAADTVDAAVSDVEKHLQPLMDAIKAGTSDQNTPTPITPEPVPPEVTGGADTTGETISGGDTNTNSVAGGAGDDSITGGGAPSTVAGGTGDDSLGGTGGPDSITGNASTPEGGAGDESITGSAGGDSITGGQGESQA